MLLSGSSDGCVTLWDARRERFALARHRAHLGGVRALQFAAQSELLCSSADDGSCLVWRHFDDVGALATSSTSTSATVQANTLIKHEMPLRSMSAHRELNALVCAGESGALLACVDFVGR